MTPYCETCGGPVVTMSDGSAFSRCTPCVDKAIAARAAKPPPDPRVTRPHNVRRTVAENRLRLAAHRFVAVAQRGGFLPYLDGSQLCVDCGAVATVFEHRDYSRPLDVEPTCRACNGRRGMGAMPPRLIVTPD